MESFDGPRQLDRYAIFEEIAAGGMATVHLGRLAGPAGFTRTVAIKRMHPHLARQEDFVAMFLDEARLAARVRHPNVVPILDVISVPGELALVMEFVQGESLWRLFKRSHDRGERIHPRIVASIASNILHGLHAAHEATSEMGEPLGIVHRDVSPANVLVGADGVARVVDFGIAKARGRLTTTREGELKGKITYMAPEQALGEPVDRRTDVFAAGIVVWEMLTGRQLLHGNHDAEIISKLLTARVPAPSTFAPDLAVLDALVLSALDRDPARRFPTARAMVIELERICPLATTTEVAAWVERLAGDTIAARAERLRAVERSSIHPSAPPLPSALDDAPTVEERSDRHGVTRATKQAAAVVPETRVLGDDKLRTASQVSSISVARPATGRPPARAASVRFAVLAAGALAGGGAVALVMALARPPDAGTTSERATTVAAPAPPSGEPAPPASVAEPAEPPAPASASAPEATASSTPPAAPPRGAKRGPPGRDPTQRPQPSSSARPKQAPTDYGF